jgi:hypothetical protein
MKTAVPLLLASAGLCNVLAIDAVAQTPEKRPLINGGFEDSAAGQPPAGWTRAYPTGEAVVASDGKDTFLRLKSDKAANAGVSQLVEVPPKVTKVAVLGRMRGKPQNSKEEKRAAVQVCLMYKNADGGNISAAIVTSENSPAWHTFRREFNLPPGCAKVEVSARSLFAVGEFDFDEVRVEFK